MIEPAAADSVPAYSVPFTLELRYTHPLGALSTYFAGLERGAALATRCPHCRRTWFAPRLVCSCGRRDMQWVELSGRGTVTAVTNGRAALPGTDVVDNFLFALIKLDAADNLCFGRVRRTERPVERGTRVELRRAEGQWAHPAQCAEYVAIADG